MDVDAADGNGDTPLLEAAGGGQVSAVNLLLSRGADVNAKGRFKRTPLYRAAFAGQWHTCKQVMGDVHGVAGDGGRRKGWR